MTHEDPAPERLIAIAAQLRLWLLALAAWLAETFGATPLGREVRRWLDAELTGTEQVARELAVCLIGPPPAGHAGISDRRCADARRAPRGSDVRRLTRGLITRTPNVYVRIARLHAFLARIERVAAMLRGRIVRVLSRLAFAGGTDREPSGSPFFLHRCASLKARGPNDTS